MNLLTIHFTALPNGLVRGHDSTSGLYGLYLKNGAPHSGDLAMLCPDAYLLALQRKGSR